MLVGASVGVRRGEGGGSDDGGVGSCKGKGVLLLVEKITDIHGVD